MSVKGRGLARFQSMTPEAQLLMRYIILNHPMTKAMQKDSGMSDDDALGGILELIEAGAVTVVKRGDTYEIRPNKQPWKPLSAEH